MADYGKGINHRHFVKMAAFGSGVYHKDNEEVIGILETMSFITGKGGDS